MTEYVGMNATITAESDHLVLVSRGLDKFLTGAEPRRIPYAAIASLQHKWPGMSNGFLRLVLGDHSPVEKPGLWSLSDDPDTVFFRIGKQARGMRELVPHLERAIDHYRQAGVDPASVPYDPPPTGDAAVARMREEVRLANRTALVGVRPDIAAAAEQLSDLADVREAIDALPDQLAAEEAVEHIASGGYGSMRGRSAVLVLTSARVLLFQKSGGQVQSDALALHSVQGVAYKSGLTGHVEVYGAGRTLRASAPDSTTAAGLVAAIRALTG